MLQKTHKQQKKYLPKTGGVNYLKS